MPNIDIPLPDELEEALAAPKCIDLGFPPPKGLKVQLPTGGSLQALQDIGKSIPTDCSLTFSLMLQLAPLLASMDCVLKILKLLKPLSDAVTSPPPGPGLIKEIVQASADLAPCFLMVTPAGMIPFVRDILCLILTVLRCLIGQLETVAEVMGGLAIQLKGAEDAGNADLQKTLACAQENAVTSAQHLMKAMEPLGIVLDLAGPVMAIAGVEAVKLPQLGSPSDTESVRSAIGTLHEVVDTIQQIVDALGGCPT